MRENEGFKAEGRGDIRNTVSGKFGRKRKSGKGKAVKDKLWKKS